MGYLPKSVEERWKEIVLGDLDISKLLPISKRLIVPVKEHLALCRVHAHKRAKRLVKRDIINKKEIEEKKRNLPEEYKRGFTFNDGYIGLCPNPFSIDLYRGGFPCYRCIYCFAIPCMESLLSAFYDDYHHGLISYTRIETLRKQFEDAINGKTHDMVSKAIQKGQVLHVGNNIDSFIEPLEKKTGIAYEFLKLMKEYDYPVILNSKSTIFYKDKFFKILSEMDKVMVQTTIVTPYDEVGKKIEPGAPLVSERFEMLKTLNESGIVGVVRAEPLMWGITTTSEEIKLLGWKALEAGVKYINVGAYNQGVQSKEIRMNFAKEGYNFKLILEAAKGLFQTLFLEKAIFLLKDMGLKVGSFNPRSSFLNDSSDCCGYQAVLPNKAPLDNFNIHEIAREIARRGKMSYEEMLKWAKPIYSESYIKRMKNLWFGSFPCSWWGGMRLERVGGIVRNKEDESVLEFKPERIVEEYEEILKKMKKKGVKV